MIRGNCPKCGSVVFEMPEMEDFGKPFPVKLTCWGCGREISVRRNKARQVLIYLKGGTKGYPILEYE